MTQQKRINWLDGIRGLSILWIMIVHFLVIFTEYTQGFSYGRLGVLLYGITGKLAVAACSVILGYFASKPSRVPVWVHAVRRYVQFALPILVIELFYFASSRMGDMSSFQLNCAPFLLSENSVILRAILRDAFLFETWVVDAYWCVRSFFVSSVLIFGMSRLLEGKSPWLKLAACLMLMVFFGILYKLWHIICLMGWLLRIVEEMDFSAAKKPLVWVVLLLPVPWLIRRPECSLTYLLDGVASVLVCYVCFQWRFAQRVLGARPLSWLGRLSMELFLWHIPVFHFLRNVIGFLYYHGQTWPVWKYLLIGIGVFGVLFMVVTLWRRGIQRLLRPMMQRQWWKRPKEGF